MGLTLNDGIDRNSGDGHTSIFGNHRARLDNAFLAEAVAEAESRMRQAAAGVDAITPLEKFAIMMLGIQVEHRTGRSPDTVPPAGPAVRDLAGLL